MARAASQNQSLLFARDQKLSLSFTFSDSSSFELESTHFAVADFAGSSILHGILIDREERSPGTFSLERFTLGCSPASRLVPEPEYQSGSNAGTHNWDVFKQAAFLRSQEQ